MVTDNDETLTRVTSGPLSAKESAEDPRYLEHVDAPGSRYHVVSWTNLGKWCSEPKCIINKRGRQ